MEEHPTYSAAFDAVSDAVQASTAETIIARLSLACDVYGALKVKGFFAKTNGEDVIENWIKRANRALGAAQAARSGLRTKQHLDDATWYVERIEEANKGQGRYLHG